MEKLVHQYCYRFKWSSYSHQINHKVYRWNCMSCHMQARNQVTQVITRSENTFDFCSPLWFALMKHHPHH